MNQIEKIPKIFSSWRESRDPIYSFVGSVAAVLVVIAFAAGRRPSDSLAALAKSLGMSSIHGWFTSSAPPLITARIGLISYLSFVFGGFLFVWMIIVLPIKGKDEDNSFLDRPIRLIGCPCAVTVWVLLLIAAQEGNLRSLLQPLISQAWIVFVILVVALVMRMILFLILSRCYSDNAFFLCLRHCCIALDRLGHSFFFASVAVLFSAIYIPLAVITWATSLESEEMRRIRMKIEHEHIQARPRPTGAIHN